MHAMNKKRGMLNFDRNGPDEYDPDAVLADMADIPDVQEKCETCGEKMTIAGGRWVCPNCHPDFEQSGDLG
jgi:tRNA G26 N,N-dimethylase Trm1